LDDKDKDDDDDDVVDGRLKEAQNRISSNDIDNDSSNISRKYWEKIVCWSINNEAVFFFFVIVDDDDDILKLQKVIILLVLAAIRFFPCLAAVSYVYVLGFKNEVSVQILQRIDVVQSTQGSLLYAIAEHSQ